LTVSTRTENRFAWLFLDSSLALLAGLFLTVTWSWSRQSKAPFYDADFSSFYLAARILHSNPEVLYDTATQKAFQEQIAQFSLKPYIHPPFETLLFWPLGYFTYPNALRIWIVLNLLLVILLPFGLCRIGPGILKKHRRSLFLLAVSFYPFLSCILQGQDSILYLWILVGTIGLLNLNRQLLAGGVLGFGLIKPQLTIFLIFPFLLRGRIRLLLGFLLSLAILLGISTWVVGPAGLSQYYKVLSAASSNDSRPDLTLMETNQRSSSVSLGQHPGRMHNWTGQLSLWGFRAIHGTGGAIVLTLVGCCLLMLVWSKNRPCESNTLRLQYAATLLVAMLSSIHLYLHDIVIVYLVIVLCFENWLSSSSQGWNRHWVVPFLLISPLIWIIAAVPGSLLLNLGVVWMTLLLLLLIWVIRRNSLSKNERASSF